MSYAVNLLGAVERNDLKTVAYVAAKAAKLPVPEEGDWLGYQYVIRAASVLAHGSYSEALREYEERRLEKDAWLKAWDLCVAMRGGAK